MPRAKTLFNKEELFHVFNSQSQESGHAPKRQVFFMGTRIYSYGMHYLLGQIHTTPNMQSVILINSWRYSKTTAGHISSLEHASSNRIQFSVPNPSEPLDPKNLSYLKHEFLNAFDFFIKARSNGRFDSLQSTQNSFNQYCEVFNIKDRIEIPADMREVLNEIKLVQDAQAKREQLKRDQKYAVQYAEREAQRKLDEIENKKNRQAWLNGEDVTYNSPWNEAPKLRIKGDFVETSKGARVPLEAAVKLLQAIEAGLSVVGKSIGHYQVEKITKKLIVIGCHDIPRSEARRVLMGMSPLDKCNHNECGTSCTKSNVIQLKRGA
jgi:hypothetical protein